MALLWNVWLSIEQLLNEAKVYISLLLTVRDLKRCARIKKKIMRQCLKNNFIVKLNDENNFVYECIWCPVI